MKNRAIVVPHTHWDREWYLCFEEFRFHLVEALDRVLSLLGSHPRYKFTLDGQVIPLLDYLEIRPERAELLRRYIREGRLLVGPWYVQPDEFLVSGEALVRNLLLGTRIARDFGGAMLEGYVPDAFGHIAQLPQILRGFGIESAFVMRGADEACEKAGGADFVWKAPDGSGVLCHAMEAGYCNAERILPDPAELTLPLSRLVEMGVLDPAKDPFAAFLELTRERSATGVVLLLNGCDHRGPQMDLPRVLEELAKRLPGWEFPIGTLGDYVERLREVEDRLPELSGELRTAKRHPILAGVLSARMYLKQENFVVQGLLERYAEPLSALARAIEGSDLRPFLRKAWELLLQNHAHDSICGTGVDPIHREMEVRFARAEAIAREVAHRALATVGTAFSGDDEDGCIVVFNPAPWERRAEVEAAVAGEGGLSHLVGPSGEEVPCSVRGKGLVSEGILEGVRHRTARVISFQDVLPPLGVKVYRVGHGEEERGKGTLLVGNDTIENEFYRVTLHSDGTLDLLDKETGDLYRELNLLEDSGDAGDEYNYAPPPEDALVTSAGLAGEIRVVEDLPWKASLRVNFEYSLPLSLTPDRRGRSQERVGVPVSFTVTLHRGIKRLDIVAEVENRARDHRLRVAFPTGIRAERSIAEDAFWVMERPTTPPSGKEWIEIPPTTHPQKSFVAVEDGKRGFAVLNRGLPEYEATPDGAIYLTLLRCVGWLSRDDLSTRRGHAGPPYETPEAQCLGRHRFEYAIYTYSGTWEESGLLRTAWEFTSPPLTTAVKGGSSAVKSLLSLEPAGAVLSAVKLPEEGEGVIVRIYNPLRRRLDVQLRVGLPISRAWEVRLDETTIGELKPVSPHLLRLPLRPGEIKTLKLFIAPDSGD